MERNEMQRRIQLHLLDLLAERVLISPAELHAAKSLVDERALEPGVPLRKGAERGKSGNL
ncbi:MAG: hypothetical protein HFI44_11985 [Lachnospiraceae bacterium]|nr:hypothetical protein [Lachnospiraceae bacterium]GFI01832.1 hypothetical protein IMSAGC005_00658 [Lachnospiraceae bacterium]